MMGHNLYNRCTDQGLNLLANGYRRSVHTRVVVHQLSAADKSWQCFNDVTRRRPMHEYRTLCYNINDYFLTVQVHIVPPVNSAPACTSTTVVLALPIKPYGSSLDHVEINSGSRVLSPTTYLECHQRSLKEYYEIQPDDVGESRPLVGIFSHTCGFFLQKCISSYS